MPNPSPDPIDQPEEVQQNPDPKIDQDYPGYPHAPATEKRIHPETKTEEKEAQTDQPESDKTYGGNHV